MHAIADFIKNSRIIRTFAKLVASGWILFLILGMLFTEEYQEYASKAQKAIFSYAFKLGARLTLETLTD